MPDNDYYKPQLTRKEIKLIKLLRMQSCEQQEKISEKVDDYFNKWIENGRSVEILEDDGTETEALWLNTEYYRENR